MTGASYTAEQLAELAHVEEAVREQLAARPKRLVHTLGVADTAVQLALAYGVDPYLARVTALLHDWCKDVRDPDLVPVAAELGIDFGVDLALVAPLLHGVIAERILPERFPELPAEVFRAIGRHTMGAADMSPLDMVIFVADGIEPGRGDVPAIQQVRDMVGKAPLAELFFRNFSNGLIYVIETDRYLYPGTLDIYNELVLARRNEREHV